MKKVVLRAVLVLVRALGLFAVSRRITRRDLRILGYHGAALDDEYYFSPGLFMSEATFAQRMQFLFNNRYPVLGLVEALDRLNRRDLPDLATVITIDDGWFGTYRLMAPILKQHEFPATLYVSTYYLDKQTQVFNVAVGYVLWKSTDRGRLDLAELSSSLSGTHDLADPRQRETVHRKVVTYGESLSDASTRQKLLVRFCELLDVDWAAICRSRIVAFVTGDELQQLATMGIDAQLHSHRHRFPADCKQAASKEIRENRAVLAKYLPGPFEHFCYPSGVYDPAQFAWLQENGIRSSTTTKAGFTRSADRPLELGRFLDSESITQLEFEAEMSGFFELIRRLGYSI